MIKKILLFAATLLFLSPLLMADEWKLKYDYLNDKWVYAPEDAKYKYDSINQKWILTPKNSVYKYNYMNKSWGYVQND